MDSLWMIIVWATTLQPKQARQPAKYTHRKKESGEAGWA
jgi:hypothetical protein